MLGRKGKREMGKKDLDIVYFVSFCIEQYKHSEGLGGEEVMRLFDRTGLLDYLSDNYEILHTQSQQWLLEEMKEYLNNHTI